MELHELIGPIVKEENKLLDTINELSEEMAWGLAFTSEITSGLIALHLRDVLISNHDPPHPVMGWYIPNEISTNASWLFIR